MAIVTKRTVMTLFSDAADPYSHQVRIVLAEKGVNVEIQHVTPEIVPQELIDLNPYRSVPTLVDRELVLYHPRIIMEYLDERFPHPPLLPVYPVARAESRKLLYRINKDWYSLMGLIHHGDENQKAHARTQLQSSLHGLSAVFADKPYFLSDEFTLVDCCIAPLLWRLPQLGIQLSEEAKPVWDYASRVFSRDSFQMSLTELEKELRAA